MHRKAEVKCMYRKVFFYIFFLIATVLMLSLTTANAYQTYSTNGSTGNCASCHGDFRTSNYTSLADGASWGNLHDVHRNTMLSGECSACHSSSGRFPVILNSSSGTGSFNLSCVGCHGRAETGSGGQVTGAGLRQHHWINGVTECLGCHSDSNPATFVTVGEDVLPPYYFTPDANHPNKPTAPCNPNGEENFAATARGLDNDGDGIYDLNDSDCQAAVPDINLNPAALSFGSVVVTNSSILSTQIENLGSADLVVSTIAPAPGTSTEFTFTDPGLPLTVPAGGSQSLFVTYEPTDTGADTGSLVLTSNDPDEPAVSLSITGTGDPLPTPDINLNPASLTIGSVLIGDSLSQNFVIQNLGTAALIINSIAPAGGTSAEFSFSAPATPFTIPVSGNQSVTVTYQPVDTGTDNGSIIITSNDPDEPLVSLSVSATGDNVQTPDINLSLTTVNFNTAIIGKTTSRTVTIQNLGTGDLTVNAINLCTGTTAEYGWQPDAPFTLLPQTSQVLTVSYTPVDENTDSGCLAISSNDPDEAAVELGLEGTGVIYKSSVLRYMPAVLNAVIQPKKNENTASQ